MSIKKDLLQVPATSHLIYQVLPATTTTTSHLTYQTSPSISYQSS
jgi:hypothetical protein